jgi:ligand-binding sensor domain-containing protein/two-component sensor histidine kinase
MKLNQILPLNLKFINLLKVCKSRNLLNHIALLILIVFTGNIFSQSSKFEHISIQHGLSHNTVHSIIQDSDGFIWFATEDGLNRYDGYNFKIFRNSRLDSSSLSDNFIWTLFEDSNGNIWVGTNNGGLNKYNSHTESFTRFMVNSESGGGVSNNSIRAIYEDKEGRLWIGTGGGGLNLFNKINETFSVYLPQVKDNILDIDEDNFGNLLVATDGSGIIKLDKNSGEFESIINKSENLINSIWSFAVDDENNIWIGTNGSGLLKYDGKKFQSIEISSDNGLSQGSSNITDIHLIEENEIWVSTEGGLFRLNKNGKILKSYYNIPTDQFSLRTNIIRRIYIDDTGILWVGTVGSGVNKLVFEYKKVKHYTHNPSVPNSLSHDIIRSVYEEKNGLLWIGTLGGGLNLYDPQTNNFNHFKHDPKNPKSLSNDGITAIHKDMKGNLWIGTWGGGLNKLSGNKYTNSFEHFEYQHGNKNSLINNIVQAIHEDSKGNLWIGTEKGLDYFQPAKNKFIHFVSESSNDFSLSDNRIQSNCIFEDSRGNLWIGTWNGLNKLVLNGKNIESNSLKFYRYENESNNPFSLSDSRITAIYEDAEGQLWIGTHGGGLNRLVYGNDEKEISFVNYSKREGLASNVIYGILGDDEGNLWISTNDGLSKFDIKNESFRNYQEGDGFQSNQFFWGASAKGRDGKLYFGGINGLNSFYPSELKDNPHIPPVYITEMQIFNKPLNISSNDSPLKKSIMHTDLIELSYDIYVLSFEFVALDYVNSDYNKYEYMLVGFDQDWIPSGTRRYVTYSNLKNGEYEFKVKGSNNDGVWNKQGTSLKIIIETPFWKAWWFISLVVILFILLIIYFITSQFKQILAVERLRTKLAADLHDNIGSGLTEIAILSEVLSTRLQHESKDILKSLKMISTDSRQIIDKMSDIVWLANPKRDSLYDLILRLEDNYSELLSQTNISFKSKNLRSLENVSLTMEHRQHLFLIFKEGINNCITHGSCTEINLNADVKGKTLNMVLEDNGKGFDTAINARGNGLENMKNRAMKIGGDLKIFSSVGYGTKIQFVGYIK